MQSLKEFYKQGNGPSSSHTMGPKKAAEMFKKEYKEIEKLFAVEPKSYSIEKQIMKYKVGRNLSYIRVDRKRKKMKQVTCIRFFYGLTVEAQDKTIGQLEKKLKKLISKES